MLFYSFLLEFSKVETRDESLLQGDWTQTVKSNLAMTDRNNVINLDKKEFSVQGRLEIYP